MTARKKNPKAGHKEDMIRSKIYVQGLKPEPTNRVVYLDLTNQRVVCKGCLGEQRLSDRFEITAEVREEVNSFKAKHKNCGKRKKHSTGTPTL